MPALLQNLITFRNQEQFCSSFSRPRVLDCLRPAPSKNFKKSFSQNSHLLKLVVKKVANSFDFLEETISKLAKARFGEPTEIQEKAIPLVMGGKNVLCIAPTGFGKTEAAFLPVLSKLLKSAQSQNNGSGAANNENKREGIRFLYVTPLKALNRDMLERMKYWCKLTGVSLAVRHGDTTASERVKQRDNPPEVLVTTPETLNSLLIGPLRNSLRNVEWLVVDEVHELVDSKRGIQLSTCVERLKERISEKKELEENEKNLVGKKVVEKSPLEKNFVEKNFVKNAVEKNDGNEKNSDNFLQIIGLSATVGSEQKVAEFLAKDAIVVKSSVERKIDLKIEFPAGGSYLEFTKLWSLDAHSGARVARIRQLIETHENSLIFVNTRSLAESLASLLYQAEELKKIVGVHHGSLAREARLEAEQKFKQQEAGGLKAIICTSSLELGIDVGKVNLVVQYHSPRQASRLLQRVGRSGHSKQKTPKGIVLAVSGLDCVESAVLARQALAGELEETQIEENAFDVLAHQVAGIVLDQEIQKDRENNQIIESKKAYEILRRAFPFQHLTPQQFLLVCRQLKNQKLLFISEDFSKLAATRATKLYYYENVSTIADSRKYFVKNAGDRKNVAVLDEAFVSEYLQEGGVFITRGIPWRVLSVTDDEVVVEQSGDYSAAIPDWVGEEIPVSPETAGQVRELVEKTIDLLDENPKALSLPGSNKGQQGLGGEKQAKELLEKKYYCDAEAAAKIASFCREQAKFFPPRQGIFFAEWPGGKTVVLHTFAGSNSNEALARGLSSVLAEKTRGSVYTRISAYSIAFDFARNFDAQSFKKVLEELKPEEVERILVQALPGTAMFRKAFADVARRFGLLKRDADLRAINLKRLVENHRGTPVWEEALKQILFEKLDVNGAAKALREKKGIQLVFKNSFSPLAMEFIDFGGSYGELLAPTQATHELLEAFKQNLLAKTSKLVCNYCSNSFSKLNKEMPERVKCPHCGSSQLTLAEYAEVLKKAGAGREELKSEERKELAEARRIESLVEAYGKNALVALGTYGVGPETAVRVLRRLRDDEIDFYNDLLEAQKSFVKTRKFWKI